MQPPPPFIPPTAPPLFEYIDGFLCRPMRVPFNQSAQVDAPLHLIEAFAARRQLHHAGGYAVEDEQPRLPSAYMRVSLRPAQLQRAAIGFTMAASHELVTAPARGHPSLRVRPETTRRWEADILRRVMGNHVAKIQVRAACRAHSLCCVNVF